MAHGELKDSSAENFVGVIGFNVCKYRKRDGKRVYRLNFLVMRCLELGDLDLRLILVHDYDKQALRGL